jgi:hypothetical protein
MEPIKKSCELSICLKPSILRKNFKKVLRDHVKTEFENKSVDDGFITKIHSVSCLEIPLDYITAELNVNCQCNVSMLQLKTGDTVPIKITISKDEGIMGILPNCDKVRVLVPRKGVDGKFNVGDTITVNLTHVRYEPCRISCRGVFVR